MFYLEAVVATIVAAAVTAAMKTSLLLSCGCCKLNFLFSRLIKQIT